MSSIQNLIDSVADDLDPNVLYGDRLRSGGFCTPDSIRAADSAQQLADACGLRFGEANMIWKAARACKTGKQCLTAFNIFCFKTAEICWLIWQSVDLLMKNCCNEAEAMHTGRSVALDFFVIV